VLRPNPSSFIDRVRWKVSRSLGTVPRSAIKRLDKQRPSLMHVHFGVDAVKVWPMTQALDLPMLVTLHGYDINIDPAWWEAGHGGAEMRNYPTKLLHLAAHRRVRFIAVSDAIRRRAISYGIPEDKITVLYIGVDTSKFIPTGRSVAERAPRVLFVGRLAEKKGCEYLIRAFAKVEKVVPDARLILVGDGDLRDRLQRLSLELGVSAEFLGALPATGVLQQLHLARALCLPSVTAANGDAEGFGMVLLEAQASGVPVVTSALGGSSEGISEGITGFGFKERDVEALAAHLARVLTNDALAESLSLAGPKFVSERFSLPACTAALERLYDEVAA
jgi:glycosyltransferase involved in cell wall biosynthesis